MRFFNKHKVMALFLAFALVLTLMSDFSGFGDKKRVCAGNFEDGVYTIEGKLRHATLDQPSMGDSAVSQPMKLVKQGDSVSLRLEFKSLTSGIFKGYLYGFNYFPSWTDSENIPKSAKAESVKVIKYYEGVYDEFNDKNTGLDSKVKGKLYPHYAVMPIKWQTKTTWVQVYVPVMESINKGGGTQYARLLLDWNTLKKTDEKAEDIIGDATATPTKKAKATAKPAATKKPSKKTSSKTKSSKKKSSKSKNKKLNINNLSDGKYTISGKMLKIDKKSESMSNEAIDHNIILNVKNKKYTLTLDFSGLKVGTSKGYLSRLKYFKSGYKTSQNGVPQGKTAAVKVLSYQKNGSKRLSDTYGTDYPEKISFPMINEAKKNGYVPLQVFVPIMDAISKGSGTQPVYLKLNLNSIVAGKKKITKSGDSSSGSTKKAGSKTLGKSTDYNSGSSGKNSGSANSASQEKTASVKVSGKVYSCNIVAAYKHPVTGKVEDAGGASSYATGQGMVESVMDKSGMLEVTNGGSNYLTMRLGLMDYTSSHRFYVQKRGSSSWSEVSPVVTKKGTDSTAKSNGTGIKADGSSTADYCIPVPDRDCIVKVSMYVEPMGRNVVFFAYPKDFKSGKPSGMNMTKVGSVSASSNAASDSSDANEDTQSGLSNDSIIKNSSSDTAGDSVTDSSETDEAGLEQAQGLSLSTAKDAATGTDSGNVITDGTNKNTNSAKTGENMTMLKWFIVISLSMTLSGLILIIAGAGVVYYFRRNWRRWGEEMEDDED